MELALSWHAWFTLAVIVLMVAALVREIMQPEFIALLALAVLLIAGVLRPAEAFYGFAHPATITVASLFVVAAGVHKSGILNVISRVLFPKSNNERPTLLRVMGFTACFSAILNNTPVVAMMIPQIQEWAKKHNISSSRLLIPLSYAAITGGTITLIGTSTNMILSGMLVERGYEGFKIFELAWAGVPATAALILYFALWGYKRLPGKMNKHADQDTATYKAYQFDVKVENDSPYANRSIKENGFRDLGAAYLTHISRKGHIISPVSPDEIIQPGDTLTFTGSISPMKKLLSKKGLSRSVKLPDEAEKSKTLNLYQAIITPSSSLSGSTLKDFGFRERFQGVVLAIHRGNENIMESLGQIVLKPGDLLVIEAPEGFDKKWNNSDDFYLVTSLSYYEPDSQKNKPLALAILVAMITSAATGLLPIATAALSAAILIVLTGYVSPQQLRSAINLPILIVIAAALGIGKAIDNTGLAEAGAHNLVHLTEGMGILAVIIALYIATNLLTEMITNNGAAVLMAPIGIAVARQLEFDPHAAIVAIAIASSACFMSPLGYQTNLMVMGPGNYRFIDFFKAGWPASLIVMTVTIIVINFVWLN